MSQEWLLFVWGIWICIIRPHVCVFNEIFYCEISFFFNFNDCIKFNSNRCQLKIRKWEAVVTQATLTARYMQLFYVFQVGRYLLKYKRYILRINTGPCCDWTGHVLVREMRM